MKYTVDNIENNKATVTFEDGSWAKIDLWEGMSEDAFNYAVKEYAPKPKTGEIDTSFIKVGEEKDTINVEQVADVESVEMPQWLSNRIEAYGTLTSQIEFITERGISAWKSHVAEIKKQFPKEE